MTTLTQQGAAKLAEAMQVRADMANQIGLSLDIAVPFGFAGSIKAARASRILMGRISLAAHEARAVNPRLGGHTMLKHVGKDEAWLRNRLTREPMRKIVSSCASLEQAERAISETMHYHVARIKVWANSAPRSPLGLVKVVVGDIGYGVTRETGKLTRMNKVRVVLRCERYNDMLTTF